MSTIYKNNSSGITGVSFETKNNKFRAYLNVDGRRKYLGYYQNLEDAINARRKAEQKYIDMLSNETEIECLLRQKFDITKENEKYELSIVATKFALLEAAKSYKNGNFKKHSLSYIKNKLIKFVIMPDFGYIDYKDYHDFNDSYKKEISRYNFSKTTLDFLSLKPVKEIAREKGFSETYTLKIIRRELNEKFKMFD